MTRLPRITTKSITKAIDAHGDDLMLLFDGQGRIRHASASLERVLDMPINALRAMEMRTLVHPDDMLELHALMARLERAHGHGKGKPVSLRLHHANGAYVSCKGTLADASKDPDIGCHVLVLRDTREQQAVVDAYTRSADDLGVLLDHTGESFFLLDTELKLRAFNATAAERTRSLMGTELEVGMSILTIAEPGRIEDLKVMYAKILQGASFQYAYDMGHKGQGPFMELHYKPTTRDGRVTGIYVEAKDITARTLAQKALEEREADLRALVDNIQDVFWSQDLERRLITCNASFKRFAKSMSGREVAPGDDVRSFFPVADHEIIDRAQQQVHAGLDVNFTRTHRTRSGEIRHFEVSVHPILVERVVTGASVLSRDVTERVRHEEQLTELKERAERALEELNKVMECSSDLICVISRDGIIRSVNAASYPLLGYLPEEMIGTDFHRFLMEDEVEDTLSTAERVMGGTRVVGYRNHWRHKDGHAVPLEWSASFDKREELRYGIARDLTAVKDIEARLERNTARLQSTIDSISDGFFTLDHEWRFVQSNGVTEKAMGLPAQRLMGRSIWDVFPHARGQRFHELYQKAMVERVPVSADIHDDVTDTWLEVRVYPVPEGISVFYSDIGDRIKAQEALVQAHERYRLATRVANEAHWDWNIKEGTFFWGEGFRTLFALDPEVREKDPEAWSERIHEDDREHVVLSLQEAARGNTGATWSEQYRFQRSNGTYAWVQDRGEVIFDPRGSPVRMVGAMHDVTEEREKQAGSEMLHEASRLLAIGSSLETGLVAMLELVCGHTGHSVGEMWLLDGLGQELVLRGSYAHEPALAMISEIFSTKRINPTKGLPGEAWQSGEVIQWSNLSEQQGFLRREEAAELGIQDGIAVPVIYGGDRPLGVIVLLARAGLSLPAGTITLLRTLAQRSAPELAKRRTEQELSNFFTLTQDLLAVVDRLGMIHKVNPAWEKALGHPEGTLVGTTFLEHVYSEDVGPATDILASTGTGRREAYSEYRILDGRGDPHWYAWSTSLPDAEGLIYLVGKDIDARKVAEGRLLELTERLGTFQESITDALYTLDTDWRFTYMNAEAEKLIRQDRKTLLGKVLWEAFPESVATSMFGHFQRAMETGNAVHFEQYYPPLAGWFEHHVYPSPTGPTIFFRDVTENRTTQRLLILERAMFAANLAKPRAIKANLDDLLVGLDALIPGMHSSLLTLDATGKTLSTLSAPGLPADYNALVMAIPAQEGHGSCGSAAARRHAVISGDIATDPVWEHYRDRTLAHGLRACWSYPILAHNGKLLGTFANYFNEPREPGPVERLVAERITQTVANLLSAKMSEETEHMANERYELVSRATNDATWDWDLLTDYWHWGDGFRARFGYDPALEPRNIASWQDHLHPEDSGRVMLGLREMLRSSNMNTWEDEYRFLRVDGSVAHVYDRGFVIRDEQGAAIRMVGAMQDITDRKDKELALRDLYAQLAARAVELEASNTDLERFAFIASHDLQEPLRMITSFLQLIDRRVAKDLDDKSREYIRFAIEGASRMKQLILDLLEYSRVGATRAAPEKVDLKRVVAQVKNILMADVERTQARIEVGDVPLILANPNQMIQLMQNLIGNAIRYRSTKAPVIHISGTEGERHWTIRVQDNGIGIDGRYFEKIFIIFQRLHPDRKDNATGIGLSICKRIVENHQGRIWVESTPGNGSTFIFTIPKPTE